MYQTLYDSSRLNAVQPFGVRQHEIIWLLRTVTPLLRPDQILCRSVSLYLRGSTSISTAQSKFAQLHAQTKVLYIESQGVSLQFTPLTKEQVAFHRRWHAMPKQGNPCLFHKIFHYQRRIMSPRLPFAIASECRTVEAGDLLCEAERVLVYTSERPFGTSWETGPCSI